jgi:hypothetical protein
MPGNTRIYTLLLNTEISKQASMPMVDYTTQRLLRNPLLTAIMAAGAHVAPAYPFFLPR